MGELGLPGPEFTEYFRDGLGLHATPEKGVQGFGARRDLVDGFPSLEDDISGFEAADVHRFARGQNDFLSHGRAEFRHFSQRLRGGHGQSHQIRKSRLLQLVRGGGSYSRELLDALGDHCNLRHVRLTRV